MSRLTISRAALDLIESFEGFRARSAMLKNGTYTIGFGHSATARAGMQITREQAEELLRWDLRPIEDLVRQSCHAPISQNQFDALVSFAFNIGADNFLQSDVLRHINQGEPVAAAIAMSSWRRAFVNGKLIVVDALVRRRYAEVNLYFETIGARPAAPTSVIVPKLDYSAALLAPNPETIKQIAPNKTDGEFGIKEEVQSPPPSMPAAVANEPVISADTSDIEVAEPAPQENASSETSEAAAPKVETPPVALNANNKIPKAHVEAILDAKLGEGLMPFPEASLETAPKAEPAPANMDLAPKMAPANDEKAKAKAHDVFRAQGIELKEIAREPIKWAKFVPWFIAALGAIAMLYGFNQMGELDVFAALGFGKGQNPAPQINEFGFRAILISICGFAATLLAGLSIIDKSA